MVNVTRPVLRYHGGKFALASWVIANLPPHRVYTEVYGGAASVLLRKPPAEVSVYNDMNGDIVNLFRVLRDPASAKDLVAMLRLTPYAREEFDAAREDSPDAVERARRTIVRSWFGVSTTAVTPEGRTGFRGYSRIDVRTPPACEWVGFPDALEGVVSFFQRNAVIVENRDACDVLLSHDSPHTVHYVDPPYVMTTRHAAAQDRGCYAFEMDDEQHRRLAATLHNLAGMVVLSGYPCELYDAELYPRWRRVTRRAFADGAKARTEVLWLNPAATRNAGNTLPLFDEATP